MPVYPNTVHLDKPITIEKYINDASVGYEEHYDWFFLKNTNASIFIRNGNMLSNTGFGPSVVTSAEITVRIDNEIDYNCRIIYGPNKYKILHIEPMDDATHYKIISTSWNETTGA